MKKPRIIIVMDGGLISHIVASSPVKVLVKDYCIDGVADEDPRLITDHTPGSETKAYCYVYEAIIAPETAAGEYARVKAELRAREGAAHGERTAS